MGQLFVVATPIGNLGDMTPRAVDVLRSVRVIAAEDTRHSSKLLRAFDIQTRAVSYHQHNERSRAEDLVRALEEGDVALITDAGTPGVSDPGAVLVRAAREAGHRIVPIPGASAVMAAVSASGLVEGPFLFHGFLERSRVKRATEIARLSTVPVAWVLFESPNRLASTLSDLAGVALGRTAVVARELTKLHEEIVSGTLDELADRFGGRDVKGEIVIVIGPAPDEREREPPDAVRKVAGQLLAAGMKPSAAARELAKITGLSGADAYAVIRETKG